MNTYITYSKLLSLVHPYFLMSGWEDFMTTWELAININLAIQDLINNSSFSFMSEFQKIEPEEELYKDTYKVFKVDHCVNRVHELLIDWDPLVKWEMTERMPYLDSREFFYKRGTNVLYWNACSEFITLNYEKEYEINNMVTEEDLAKELPIPFTFVPALIKMIYDNTSMFTFFQWEGATTDFYGHGKTRLNDLVNTDLLSSKQNVKIWE